jgi:hypothetical protein
MRSCALALLLAAAGCRAASASPKDDRGAPAVGNAPPDAAVELPDAARVDAGARDIGPYSLPYLSNRSVFVSAPSSRAAPQRLLANLHGLCNPPGYACGHWTRAASEVGFLVCPEGNGRCGAGDGAPPTWTESFEAMGADLERAVAATEGAFPDQITREGAVLTGFSRGAYAAAAVAVEHPGRWPFLILVEGDVTLTVPMLRRGRVRAVAMLAGEWGTQLAGSKKTCEALARQGHPARLFVMRKAGHSYSADIDELMRQALAFVLAQDGA